MPPPFVVHNPAVTAWACATVLAPRLRCAPDPPLPRWLVRYCESVLTAILTDTAPPPRPGLLTALDIASRT